MCGIAGFIDFKRRSTLDDLRKMTVVMPHRGPDGQGEFLEDLPLARIGLGHRRLSIIDLSHAADQPMHFEDLSIVFNGEVYNYDEIRNELIGLGHQFETHSDTEVILHSWKAWGIDAIKKWRGMFAIFILDRAQQKVTCIRDRAGVKPFYYYFKDGLFLFGSELKCLMAHPNFPKVIDPAAVASFLQYGYVSAPYSIFKDTQKIEPGHLLEVNLKNEQVALRQYWNVYDYYNRPKIAISLPEAIKETEIILKKAFEYRMVSDVPVGVFLSGGYDSTCVTALLQQGRTDKIKTFTIGTTDGKMDEAPFAKEIAQRLGTDHTEYYCSIDEALDIIPSLPEYYDEPFADSSAIPTMLVCKLARQQVTVALSADAGDEIFAGYNRYDYISRYGDKLKSIPAPLRKLGAFAMSKISSEAIPVLKSKANFHSRYDKLKNLLQDPSPAQLLKNLSVVFSDDEMRSFMAASYKELYTAHTSTALEDAYYDPLSFMMAVDYQTYLADDILQKVDRAGMSVALEGREPFLDQHIIEWAAQLPTSYKYHNGIKKYPLREIVHHYIPKEMMDRPKMGFGIPVNDWLQNALKPLVLEHLSDAAIQQHSLFNLQVVQKLVREFYAGRTEKYLKIWYLLMFQMWYKKWIA
ncbi:MAG: asparagine synthase (glutamine-hydrolyzing) [Bacteroidetes bacterium]|nr:asparagine synthase (glutamine-hydrolyzing) [Bacteroidota bacterium]